MKNGIYYSLAIVLTFALGVWFGNWRAWNPDGIELAGNLPALGIIGLILVDAAILTWAFIFKHGKLEVMVVAVMAVITTLLLDDLFRAAEWKDFGDGVVVIGVGFVGFLAIIALGFGLDVFKRPSSSGRLADARGWFARKTQALKNA